MRSAVSPPFHPSTICPPTPALVPTWSLTCDLGSAGQQRAWAACGARHRGAARAGRGGGGAVAAEQLACARAPQRPARAPRRADLTMALALALRRSLALSLSPSLSLSL